MTDQLKPIKAMLENAGNVLLPRGYTEFSEQCDICGDHDCIGGLPCLTGDGE